MIFFVYIVVALLLPPSSLSYISFYLSLSPLSLSHTHIHTQVPSVQANLFSVASERLSGNKDVNQNDTTMVTERMWLDLEDRCHIIASSRLTSPEESGGGKRDDNDDTNFEHYWSKPNGCKNYFDIASFCFYLGTWSLLIGTVLWSYSWFHEHLLTASGAYVCMR